MPLTIVQGGRKYSKDASLVQALRKPIQQLARDAIFEIDRAISTIKAILILCLWPLPIDSMFSDATFALAGVALQLGVQKGLPYASSTQDFTRKAIAQNEKDRQYRVSLWFFLVEVTQK